MALNLTAKFLAGFVAASLAALGGHAVYRVSRDKEYFDSHLRTHAAAYATSLSRAIGAIGTDFGVESALLLVEKANESSPQVRARWVTLETSSDVLPPPVVPLPDLEPVRRGGRVALELPAANGGAGTLVTYAAVNAPEAEYGRTAIEVIESLREEQEFVRNAMRSTLLFSVTVLGLTSAVAAILGVLFIARPIRKLVAKAQRISSGDLGGPVVLHQRDELALLASELNAMCERLTEARDKVEAETAARITALEQVRHADRLATVGRLASGIAHEIGTPLSVAGGRIGMVASREVEGDEAVDSARIAGEQLQRISAIIRQLLDFARRRPAQKGPVDLQALAQRTAGMLAPLAGKRGVTLAVGSASAAAGEPLAQALGDMGQLEQALANLVINALHATPAGGRVEISCGSGRALPPAELGGPEGEYLSLVVTDTGTGMNAETKSHIFEPFFTTKAVGEGSGLGLAVTYGIAREHGGWMDVESELGQGSRFTIFVPRA